MFANKLLLRCLQFIKTSTFFFFSEMHLNNDNYNRYLNFFFKASIFHFLKENILEKQGRLGASSVPTNTCFTRLPFNTGEECLLTKSSTRKLNENK